MMNIHQWLPNNKENILSKVFIYHGITFCYYEMSFSAFRDEEFIKQFLLA